MWTLCWVAAGLVCAVVNVATMRRLWRSVLFERSQKITQTVLLWLIPGSFIAVRYVLAEPQPPRSIDSTADGPDTASVDSTDIVHSHHVSESIAGGDAGGGGGGAD